MKRKHFSTAYTIQTDRYLKLCKQAEEIEEEIKNSPKLSEEELYQLTSQLDDLIDDISELRPNKAYIARLIEEGLV